MIKKVFYLITLLILYALAVSAQDDTTGIRKGTKVMFADSSGLFSSDYILDISIRLDMGDYLKKAEKGTYLSAVLTFNPGTKDSIDKPVSIRSRGFFRLQHCSLPPMEINFKKPVYAYPDSGKIKKLKLSSVCEFTNKGEEYVVREFLVYKMYNVLSDTSFRVRLLRVSYIDTKKKRKPVQTYGFFIEPKNIMASRVNSVVVKNMNLTQKQIDLATMDRVAIFNYMVGNWDWAVQSLHNIVVLKSLKYSSSDLGIAVPHDFDLTGVVNPDYNTPSPESGLTSNRDRRYLGICRQKEVYQADLQWFLARKEKLYAVINDFPYLSQKSKKDITTYLDSFFDQLEKPRTKENLINIFNTSCLNL
jgi:hypothetical protein